ncbi:C40 family peptidase [[Clostridium] polysaccharolyticum]|uniref:SH3 domain-containing protein n=1 Tax=[Clostridium] polysaccharolyticum TaxID=29364 RepID=A0A1I0E5Z2_9FIRM|nr:SH3 domain-containing C40 family peptidase [[Clostridium] polysaccharolyticum]SET39668.1 SH3 domain-containing protein [[Clostridium] polysaccharolyticum]
MKKQLWVIGFAGFMGMSLLAFAKPVPASLLNEVSVARDDLLTEKCYSPSEEKEATLRSAAVKYTGSKDGSPYLLSGSKAKVTSVNGVVPDDEDGQEDKAEVNVSDLISNLNYDRLGIAKVDNWLNIREKPDIDAKIVGKLPKNAGCNIYSIKKGWAKIKSGKVTGYVSSEYLVTDKEAEEYALEVATKVATVKAGTVTLNTRFVPSTDSAKYTLVPEDEELEVYREDLKESFVRKFVDKYFHGEEAQYIADVDKKAMYRQLDNWMCVRLDNERVFISKDFVDVSFQLKKAVAVKELSENKSAGVTSARVSMVEYAKQFLGNRYVWGGTSLTNGTDCSGFTMSIYAHYGYGLPRTSGEQANYTRSVSSGDVRPGDLFFYGKGGNVSHVAMYIGNGLVIHASNERDGIKISNAYYRSPIKIGRVIND